MKDVNDAVQAGVRLEQLLSAADAGDALDVRSRDGELTELAIQLCDEVIGGLKAVQDRAAADELMGRLFEERALLALGVAWRSRPTALQGKLFHLRQGPKGQVKIVADLERAIKATADHQATTSSSLGALLKSLGDERVRKLEAPPGYTVDVQGVWTAGGEENVARGPIVIRRIARDLHRGTLRWTLAWRRGVRWEEAAIDRGRACDSHGILALAHEGAPVSSDNARALIRYLVAFEAHNERHLVETTFTTRVGWHGDTYVSGPGGPLALDDADGRRAGWRTEGTWEGWLRGVQAVADEPIACLVLLIGCVPPLLRWLDLGFNPVFDVFGPPNRGKTTAVRLAASAFGRPDELHGGVMQTWSQTPTYLERLAEMSWDVPFIIDDSKHIPKPEQIPHLLYTLHQGVGKGRATVDGLRPTATWRTVVLSTGERPIVDEAQGGARARVISIAANPAIRSRAIASRLETAISCNYGHLAPRLAELALRLGSDLRRRHREAVEAWAERCAGDTRILYSVAAVTVAAGLLRELGVGLDFEACDEALRHALADTVRSADHTENALDIVREDLFAHRTSYIGQEPRDARGWPLEVRQARGIWRDSDAFVAVDPRVLRDLLRARGHEIETLAPLWHAAGILDTNDGYRKRIRVDGGPPVGFYCFRRDRLGI